MNRVIIKLTGVATLAILPALPAAAESQPENGTAVEKKQQPEEEMVVTGEGQAIERIPSRLGANRIQGWYALDSRNLVVDFGPGEKYRVTFMNQCSDVLYSEDLVFDTRGPYVLDKWTTIHTPDGHQCYVKELYRMADEPSPENREGETS